MKAYNIFDARWHTSTDIILLKSVANIATIMLQSIQEDFTIQQLMHIITQDLMIPIRQTHAKPIAQ